MIPARQRPILYIEDSDIDYRSLCEALKAVGVANPVERCSSGLEAIEALSTPEGWPLLRETALVLLDLNLDGSDGRDLLKLLRSRDRTAPVIVFSTSSHPEDIAFCYENGANSYLIKPLEFERWQEMLGAVAAYWLGTVSLPPAKARARAAP
jgi:CheY-like chemotaxis protein